MCVTDPELKLSDPAVGIGRCPPGVSLPALVAMNALNLGILIVDRESRITFANDCATELLRSLRAPCTRTSRTQDSLHDAGAFDKGLRDAISGGDGRADGFIALNNAGDNSLTVQIIPYGSGDPAEAGASGSILFVSDASTKPNFDLGPAAKLYGLTPAELRLLEALLEGEKVGNYARRCGVTQNTIKGHLAQLFRKTQTGRQSELVLRILANPVFRLASRHSSRRPATWGPAS